MRAKRRGGGEGEGKEGGVGRREGEWDEGGGVDGEVSLRRR